MRLQIWLSPWLHVLLGIGLKHIGRSQVLPCWTDDLRSKTCHSDAESTTGSSLQRYTSDHGGAWPLHALYLPNLSEHVWSHCMMERSSQSTWQLGSSSQGPEQRIKSDATIWPSLPTWQKSHKSICVSHETHPYCILKFWMVKSKHRAGRMSPLCAHLKRGSASPWRDMVTWSMLQNV